MRKRVQVFPERGYETRKTSSGNTVSRRPAGTCPIKIRRPYFKYFQRSDIVSSSLAKSATASQRHARPIHSIMHWRRTNCRSGFVSRENALRQISDALHQHGIALPGCFCVAVVWIVDLAIALLSFGKGAEHMNFVPRVRIDRA